MGSMSITEQKDNVITKDYLRKSVVQLFLTYPRLAAIGVTAGENMNDMTDSEKEEWLWETYGKGVQDVKQLQPERHIRFIHRHWWTSFDQIQSRFGQLMDGFDMSFKYARARLYSTYNPPFAEDEQIWKLLQERLWKKLKECQVGLIMNCLRQLEISGQWGTLETIMERKSEELLTLNYFRLQKFKNISPWL